MDKGLHAYIIYIDKERERERECVCVRVICIYVHMLDYPLACELPEAANPP